MEGFFHEESLSTASLHSAEFRRTVHRLIEIILRKDLTQETFHWLWSTRFFVVVYDLVNLPFTFKMHTKRSALTLREQMCGERVKW